MKSFPQPPGWVVERLREGMVIPAHPLALTRQRKLDERRQAALTRYYRAAGAGGLAVGVHTTQFAIREHGLLRPVLELAAGIAREPLTQHRPTRRGDGKLVLIAGICGRTTQAVKEAELARELGYHAGLLSLGALREASERELLTHCRTVAREIPLVGFYLQPAVGGRLLPFRFWRRFVEIPNVVAIKIAPFNRYQTLDVVRAVAESGRGGDIALYTGNDDNILIDLLTEFVVPTAARGGTPAHCRWFAGAVGVLDETRGGDARTMQTAAGSEGGSGGDADASRTTDGCKCGVVRCGQWVRRLPGGDSRGAAPARAAG